jgi:serine/threonine-protein kinase
MRERDGSASVVLHPTGESVGFGPFRFDRANRILSRDGVELPLPPRVLGVLEHLLARPGGVVSKQALLDAVWKDAYVTETSLTEAVSQLRQALGDDPQQPAYVQTVHRRGYRFVAPVSADGSAAGPLRLAERGAPVDRTAEAAAPAEAPRPVPDSVAPPRPRPPLRALVPWILAGFGFATAIGSLLRPPANAHQPVTRATLSLTLGHRNEMYPPAMALAPDGTAVVYAAGDHSRLHVRRLDRAEPLLLEGTEGGAQPFVSPDAAWVGFFADGKLKKVPLAGGAVVTLCDARSPAGGSWGDDGTIVFTADEKGGLYRVPASGGTPAALTTPDSRAAEVAHYWPEVLPGSEAVLYTVWPAGGLPEARVAIASLRGGASPRTLVEKGSFARYAPAGHVVFARNSRLMAIGFDPRRAETRGEPVGLFDGVAVDWFTGAAQFTFSRTGTLAYLPGTHEVPGHELALLDRAGNPRPLSGTARPYMNLDPAPDGRRVAVTVHEGSGADLWVVDAASGAPKRLTFEAHNIEPAFSPDGQRVAFASSRTGPLNMFWVAADGTGAAERLLESERTQVPDSWTPDGRTLAFTEFSPHTGTDVWVLSLDTRTPRPFVRTRFNEEHAAFSPDGRFLAYESDETNASEVFVRPFPEGSPKWQVSASGGYAATWSPDGRELYYRDEEGVWSVPIATSPFRAGPARRLFPDRRIIAMAATRSGRGLIAARRTDPPPPREVSLVLGWFRELERLAGR